MQPPRNGNVHKNVPHENVPRNIVPNKKSPRKIALEILLRIEKDGSYSNLLLDSKLKEGGLTSQDGAFLTTLVYGVLENLICLDFFISHFAKRSAAKIQPEVRCILRLGVYQLVFLDRVPASAAAYESVELTKLCKAAYASGFVNAVLRQISQNLDNLPYPDKKSDLRRYLHIRYSCPKWLLDKWVNEYGLQTAGSILEGLDSRHKAVLRVNTLKTTTQELAAILESNGIVTATPDYLKDALEADRLPDLRHNKAFNDGLFIVQNSASQFCCAAAQAKPGDVVLDMCAAPGGKSFTLAFIMQNIGSIRSLELYENRLNLIKEGAQRLGIDIIKAAQNDASKHNDNLEPADLVLCDVPCSGLGVIGRKPEIRYKNPSEFDDLPDLQYAILCEGASHVKSGGRLVYSTCTLSRAENDEVVARFLETHSEYSPLRPATLQSLIKDNDDGQYGAGITLFPHVTYSDGFFIAVMKKNPV
jgi:16S rRNA (cytosine967-C5)-methyltransferase